jgi:hypothetical protein
MSGLFISYRRDDSQGYAGRLADDLAGLVGAERVFSDVEIPAGSDFVEVLHDSVGRCDALLIVIGRRWAAESKQGYPSRLFEPADWVRTEIEAALAQQTVIVPLLVGGAEMPAAQTLPPSIRALARLQAAPLSDRHWDDDVAQLLARLRVLVPGKLPAPRSTAPAPAPAPATRRQRSRLLSALLQPLASGLGRGLRGVLSTVFMLGLLYVGLRLFGDAGVLSQLDAIEARVMRGWRRLLN